MCINCVDNNTKDDDMRESQHNNKHHTTQRTSFRNNTPQCNSLYPIPTQNKQMSHPTFIFEQNRRGQTPITIMLPLQTELHITTHLFNCSKISTHLKVMDLWAPPWSVSLKIQDAFIRQEHNIIYNHMNENNIRLETSTKEQKEPIS